MQPLAIELDDIDRAIQCNQDTRRSIYVYSCGIARLDPGVNVAKPPKAQPQVDDSEGSSSEEELDDEGNDEFSAAIAALQSLAEKEKQAQPLDFGCMYHCDVNKCGFAQFSCSVSVHAILLC